MAGAELSTQETPTTPWWLILIEGIALILVGLMLLAEPGMSAVVLVQVLGIYWFITGIVRIVSIFIDSTQWGWKLFAGILAIIAGLIVIRHPLWSTAVLADTVIIVLGITGIVIGAISLYQAFKGAGWGTGVLGVISILLGLVLLANAWVLKFSLPVTLGVLAIVGGIAAIFGAFRARGEAKELAAMSEPDIAPATLDESTAQAAEEAPAAAPPAVEAPAAEAALAGAAVVAEAVVEEEAAVEEETTGEESAAEPTADAAPALEHHAMQFIEGIGPAYAEKLAAAGINSTESLLERGATPAGRSALAQETGISHKLILTWVNHADLMRVKGVGSQFADLLEEAGVDTIPDLARRNAGNLYEKLVAANQEKNLVRHLPSQADVESWVAMAKEMPRIVQY